MVFSRIIYSAILIGVISGAILSALQIAGVDPIIFAAESYEVEAPAEAGHSHDHGHGGHSHGDDEWAPADGFERSAYTVLSNMLAGTGFAAVLLALMSFFWLARERDINWFQGALWGLAGYLALYVAPAIGLPPEIPGAIAAPIEHRQAWWVLTAASVAVGLGLFAFAPVRFKAVAVLFFAVPYLVGAPHHEGPMFEHPDPAAVEALVDLHQQFVLTSGITNLVFWLLLGLACRLAYNRWLRNVVPTDDYAHA